MKSNKLKVFIISCLFLLAASVDELLLMVGM